MRARVVQVVGALDLECGSFGGCPVDNPGPVVPKMFLGEMGERADPQDDPGDVPSTLSDSDLLDFATQVFQERLLVHTLHQRTDAQTPPARQGEPDTPTRSGSAIARLGLGAAEKRRTYGYKRGAFGLAKPRPVTIESSGPIEGTLPNRPRSGWHHLKPKTSRSRRDLPAWCGEWL